jgi:hypothetical protein
MNWTELLKNEIAMEYGATEGLLDLVDDEALDWKPETGENWMTTGQLLFHLTSACGFCCKGFVTGDWTVPGMGDLTEASDEEMLPPAEALPTAESVAQIKEMLTADKQLALDMVDQADRPLGSDGKAARPTAADDGRPSCPAQGPALLLPQAPGKTGQHRTSVGHGLAREGPLPPVPPGEPSGAPPPYRRLYS